MVKNIAKVLHLVLAIAVQATYPVPCEHDVLPVYSTSII